MQQILVFAIIFGSIKLCFAFNIHPQKISVSGLSSGAYMAGQLHIAHSNIFRGVGIFAGGPYYCSEGSINRALNSCMDTNLSLPDLDKSLEYIQKMALLDEIDNPTSIQDSKIFVLSGQKDETVLPAVAEQTINLYKRLGVNIQNMKFVGELEMGHAFPTMRYGNACATVSQPPWLSRCLYDGAGEVLQFIYGHLKAKTKRIQSHFHIFSQSPFTDEKLESISMAENGVLYAPEKCKSGRTCSLHIVLHGCGQSIDEIGGQFYENAGYAEWAESNDIVLLFPQATKSIAAGNPKGCWDWWGYTGPNFATKSAPQIKTIHNMIQKGAWLFLVSQLR